MNRIPSQKIEINSSYYADLSKSTWSPIIQPSGTGDNYWNKLFRYYPQYQLIYENADGEWLGFANTIPARYDGQLEDLPEEGWDWLISNGIDCHEKSIRPNVLGGLQIGVNPMFRGHGLSKKILAKAKESMKDHDLDLFILPIRPTLKDQHPEISMEEYMTWQEDGKIYDPWIRTHLNAGAKFIKVCHKAMTVEGSITDWERWTNKKFDKSGKYPIDGGLSLVEIDLENETGLYLEPNIWICYM